MNALLAKLSGGDRRSIGEVPAVIRAVEGNHALFDQLMAGLWSADPLVRMRAADAVEKLSAASPQRLQRYKRKMIRLAAEADQQELCWHLAQMLPRMKLTAAEREEVGRILFGYLAHYSNIVVTFALQGLCDLAETSSTLRPAVAEALARAADEGSPAVRNRARKLKARLETISS